VVVTGSLIRGVLDMMAPLMMVSHREMTQTGYASVQDALQALPLTSLAGPREDLGVNGNYNRGAGINLRGLGVGATLVLVNGHRQPAAGLDGEFVDVSNIPWSAVDRIEVLPSGASALYGSDAIAGVVNIIMRENLQGADTQVRLAESPGGADQRLVSQLLGTHWGTGKALLAYEYSEPRVRG
jgi:outer membrane receptor for ferrienterochelin and colicin